MDPLWPADPNDSNKMADEPTRQRFLQEYYTLLEKCPLSNIEECLIARNAVFMQAYRLKSSMQMFKGNVICFPQKISDVTNILPRLPSNIKWIVTRCKKSGDPSDYRDFKVKRERISRWLLFLKKWSIAYKNIEISLDNLNELPEEEASVYDQLPVLSERRRSESTKASHVHDNGEHEKNDDN